jgi:hypothetical protein
MLVRDELPLRRIVMVVYGHSCDWKFLDILFTRKGTALVSEVCRRHIYTGIYHNLESDHPPYIKDVAVHSLLDRANYK